MDNQKLESVVGRLEAVATKLESISMKGGAGSQSSSAIVEEFEPIISGPFTEFIAVCNKIGGEVKEGGALYQKAFQASLDLMKVVSTSKKPSADGIKEVLTPLSQVIEEIKSHLEALSGFASCFAWVQAVFYILKKPAKPQAFIAESIDSGVFYANRVLSGFKDKSPEHKEFVQKLRATFEKLKEYAQEFHPMGCSWNPQGSDAKAPAATSTATASSVAKPVVKAAPAAANPGGLFAAINQGAGVTSKLKKVDDSQKTHKNPNLRAGAVVSETAPKAAAKPKHNIDTSKPPKMELEGKKWAIENQRDQQLLEITDGDNRYSIYMYNCINTNLVVHNKLNVVTLDKCHNCKVQLKSGLISCTEVTNSKKIEADDVMPFTNVNSSDGVQVFLNDKSLGTKVCTNTATAVNVCHWPENAELIEYPVPEVFVSCIKNGKLVNEVAESL